MTDATNTTDALDRVAGEIREQRLDDDAVAAATDRVWRKLEAEFKTECPLRSCEDVQALLGAYIDGELSDARALLVGDHTRECVPCRRELLDLRSGTDGSSTSTAETLAPRALPVWLKLAAAILVMIGGGFLAYTTGANLIADRHLTALVASSDGALQLVSDEDTRGLALGETIGARQRVRTAKDAGAMLRLADGSMVEMAPRSELVLRGSRRGTTVELGRGNIIVHAADQGRGRLTVVTDECRVAVKGTIFAVNHGLKGSRVSVIEGEVEVRYGETHSSLHPGDQVTTDARLHHVAVEDEIAWSVNADEHMALLRELTHLQREVAVAVDIASPRTSTRLLDLVSADTLIYVAMPNLTDGLGAARQVFSSRLADSDVLRDWWQREIVENGIDSQIEDSLDRLQFLGEAVGDEVVVAIPGTVMARVSPTPVILAELDDPAAFQDLLADELARLGGEGLPVQVLDDPATPVGPDAELLIWVTGDLVVAAANADQILEIALRIDGGGTTGFEATELHQRLAERYADGVEWLVGIDLERAFSQAVATSPPEEADLMERFGLLDASTLVLERRRSDQGSEIDAELRFDGPRRGIAAWLAEPAPLATLDFVSSEATVVTSAAAKDGLVLFDELLSMVADSSPDALAELEAFQTEIGIDLRNDLAAAIGGEGTFAIDGPLLPLPTWKVIFEVYDPATLEHSFTEVVQRANASLIANDAETITVRIDEIGGRTYTTISHPSSPIRFSYTMTDGFMVAGSTRMAVEQAISVRATGTGLARTAAFRDLLPDNGFTDCSALIYRNLSPIIAVLPVTAMGGQLSEYEELLNESAAPGLFCVYGLGDRILVSGTGPSLVGLAPILGLPSMLAAERFAPGSPEALSSLE